MLYIEDKFVFRKYKLIYFKSKNKYDVYGQLFLF